MSKYYLREGRWQEPRLALHTNEVISTNTLMVDCYVVLLSKPESSKYWSFYNIHVNNLNLLEISSRVYRLVSKLGYYKNGLEIIFYEQQYMQPSVCHFVDL